MNVQQILEQTALSEPLIQSVIDGYLAEQAKRAPTEAMALRARLSDDSRAYEMARDAVSQAVLLSTVAAIADNDGDYAESLGPVCQIDDPDIQRLRSYVFDQGIRTSIESMGAEQAMKMKLGERAEAFAVAAQTA